MSIKGASMPTRMTSFAWLVVTLLAVGRSEPAWAQDLNPLIAGEKQIFKLIKNWEYQRAEDVAVELLKYTDQNFQRQPQYIGFVLNHLSAAYCENDKYDEAEQAAKRSIEVLRKHIDANNVVLAKPKYFETGPNR